MTAKNSKHTPEPWDLSRDGLRLIYLNQRIEAGEMETNGEEIYDPAHDSVIADFNPDSFGAFSGIDDTTAAANADRVKTCVNALQGIANPEAVPKAIKALRLIERSNSFNGGTDPEELQRIAFVALRALDGEQEQ